MASEKTEMTSEEIDAKCRHLLADWRNGMLEARDSLAQLNMGLVRTLTRKYRKKTGLNQEDLLSAANTALFNALNGLFKCGHDNVRAYVTTSVEHALQDETERQFGHNKRHEQLEPDSYDARQDDTSQTEIDLLDEILVSCETLRDRAIVTNRVQGQEVDEIAKSLKMPKSTMSYRLRKIERDFYEGSAQRRSSRSRRNDVQLQVG